MTFKTTTGAQDAAYAQLADDVRVEVAVNLLDRLKACKHPWERDAVVAGMMAGAAQILWETRPNGGTLQRVIEFWNFAGETHIKQFFAEEVFGETKGGRQ